MNERDIIDSQEFSDISPFSDKDYNGEMAGLINEPGFEHAVRWAIPAVNYDVFPTDLLSIHS